jgi:hypothetical protein
VKRGQPFSSGKEVNEKLKREVTSSLEFSLQGKRMTSNLPSLLHLSVVY